MTTYYVGIFCFYTVVDTVYQRLEEYVTGSGSFVWYVSITVR